LTIIFKIPALVKGQGRRGNCPGSRTLHRNLWFVTYCKSVSLFSNKIFVQRFLLIHWTPISPIIVLLPMRPARRHGRRDRQTGRSAVHYCSGRPPRKPVRWALNDTARLSHLRPRVLLSASPTAPWQISWNPSSNRTSAVSSSHWFFSRKSYHPPKSPSHYPPVSHGVFVQIDAVSEVRDAGTRKFEFRLKNHTNDCYIICTGLKPQIRNLYTSLSPGKSNSKMRLPVSRHAVISFVQVCNRKSEICTPP